MAFIRKIKKNGATYLAEVESKRVNGKVVQKHIRYIGKEVDGQTILSSSISDLAVDKVKLYGPLIALNHIAEELDLHNLLGDFSSEILSLVFAHCIDYKSINEMSRWFERTDLNFILGLENVTEDRLLKSLDSLEQLDRDDLQRQIFAIAKKKFNLKTKGLVYDVTNTYFYGKKCLLAKQGKIKERIKVRPLIQIGLGVTKDHGVPVFHQIHNGNVHDSRIFQDAVTELQSQGFEENIAVYDRGISSSKNTNDLQKLDWKVLCGLSLNQNLKRKLDDLIKNEDLLQYGNRVKLKSSIFYAVEEKYCMGDTSGRLIFCFNEQIRKNLRESRYDEIDYARELLLEKKTIKQSMDKFFDSAGTLNNNELKKAELYDGYSCLFTNCYTGSIEEIIKMYFDKDVVEKAFRSIKGVIKVRPVRHWLYNRVIAHVFICYLAYLILSILKIMLEKKKINISPTEALKELDSLYKVYLHDNEKGFQVARVVAMSKNQEKIMGAVGKDLLKLV
jgi:transposase